jgi:hypothetical protein
MGEYRGDTYAFGRDPKLQRSATGKLQTGPDKNKYTREAHGLRLDREGARQGWKAAQEAVGKQKLDKLAKLKIKKLQKQLEAKNLSEKKAGRLGDKIRIIRLGIQKPKRGK